MRKVRTEAKAFMFWLTRGSNTSSNISASRGVSQAPWSRSAGTTNRRAAIAARDGVSAACGSPPLAAAASPPSSSSLPELMSETDALRLLVMLLALL
jgi:hypothetical protein